MIVTGFCGILGKTDFGNFGFLVFCFHSFRILRKIDSGKKKFSYLNYFYFYFFVFFYCKILKSFGPNCLLTEE